MGEPMNANLRRAPASGLSAFRALTLMVAASLAAPALPGGSALAQAAPSPAQEAFDKVNRLILEEYGGLSTVDRAAMGREYQTRLDALYKG